MGSKRSTGLTVLAILMLLAGIASAGQQPLGGARSTLIPNVPGQRPAARPPAPRDPASGAQVATRTTPEDEDDEDLEAGDPDDPTRLADGRLGAGDGGGGGALGAIGSSNGSYLLGPQDILSVEIWNRAEIEYEERSVPVTGKGTIFLPLLDDIPVDGLTVTELTDKLTKLYDEFIIEPQVFVKIKEHNSRMASVIGQVKNPGRYALKGEVLLTELIAEASDTTKYASNIVRIIRGEDDRTEVIDIDLAQINAGDVSQNIVVQPGDRVFVLTNKNIVYVSGMVKTEGYVDWEEGMTAQQAVILAGGLADGSAGNRTKIYRTLESGEALEIKVNVKDQKKPVLLEPGDIIKVPRSWL